MPTIHELLKERIILLDALKKARIAYARSAGRFPLAQQAALQEVNQKTEELTELKQRIEAHPDFKTIYEGMKV